MKIQSLQAFLLSCPFEKTIHLPYHGGSRSIFKRDAMLIRVETDNGVVGWAPGQASEKAKAVIENTIAPFLVGRALADPDALRVLFLKGPGTGHPEIARIYCSVEIGLYDALGKAEGIPVSEYLGGRMRDRIQLYGSAGMYMSPEKYAEEAAGVAALGFRAYKMRPALGPEKDIETVRRIREEAGPDLDLMVDAHTWWRMGDNSYPVKAVHELAQAFAEYDVAWLEEPLPPDDHESYKALKEANYVPLASGEHEPSDERYLDLILNECVDYVQMDLVNQGGYPTGRRILPEIAKFELSFAFHSWGTDLEVMAAAHLGICWPDTLVEWLEYPCYSAPGKPGMYPFPLASEMLKRPLEIERGVLVVPAAPGLGVEIDESVMDRYPWVPGPWSSFTLDSPAETWNVAGDHSVRWADQPK